ncbi:hypothetical protein HMI54_010386, partial [Coelomomyces lativittatus]
MFLLSLSKILFTITCILFTLLTSQYGAKAYFVVKQGNVVPVPGNTDTTAGSENTSPVSDQKILIEMSSSSPPIINETKVKEEKWRTFKLPVCEIPPNWDYFSTVLSNLFVSINKMDPFIKLNDTFATNVKGNINLLGVITGFQANYVYFRELPRIILKKIGYEIIRVEQPYYSSTCNIVSAVHRLHFKGALSSTLPVPGSIRQTGSNSPSESFLQRLLLRHTTLNAKIRKAPTPLQPISLEVWSWWLFNREGKINEYDISFQRPGFLDWHDLFPDRLEMMQHICSEFSNSDGACSTSKLTGGFSNAEACVRALSNPSISLKE